MILRQSILTLCEYSCAAASSFVLILCLKFSVYTPPMHMDHASSCPDRSGHAAARLKFQIIPGNYFWILQGQAASKGYFPS